MVGKSKSFFQRKHLQAAYRSGLEFAVAGALAAAGIAYGYEAVKVPFTQPAKSRTYCPDFLLPNGIVAETKGLWDADDRAKIKLIREQHPNLELRMVFSNPNAKIRKGSPTTYAHVCEKLGIKYAKKEVPEEWITEPPNESSLAVLRELGWKPSG